MFVLTNTAGASATTPPASKTTLFVDASGVPSTKNNGGTVTPLLTGPAAALAYQPLDSDLSGIAGITYTADQTPYYNGTAWATYTVTSVGRTFLAATTQAAQRTALGLGTSATRDVASGASPSQGNDLIPAGYIGIAADSIQIRNNVASLNDASLSGLYRAAAGSTGNPIPAGAFLCLHMPSGSTATYGAQLGISEADARIYQRLKTNGVYGSWIATAFDAQVVHNTGPENIGGAKTFTAVATFNGGTTIAVAIAPQSDNSIDVGSASLRFRTYYGVNSAINTSDARLKTEPRQLSEAERKAGSELARLPAIWEWLTGDRLHAGPTVQAAIAIMEAHGLDPFAYSFICYDEWEAEPEQWHEWPAKDAVLDDDGNVLEPAVEAGRELIQPARESGDRYSFRKEELLCFMVSALAAENDAQAAKIEAMDVRLAALEART